MGGFEDDLLIFDHELIFIDPSERGLHNPWLQLVICALRIPVEFLHHAKGIERGANGARADVMTDYASYDRLVAPRRRAGCFDRGKGCPSGRVVALESFSSSGATGKLRQRSPAVRVRLLGS